MRKSFNILLACATLMFSPLAMAECPQTASQTVSATLTRTVPPPPGPGPTPGPGGGAAVGIAAGGAAAAGASAFAFTPLLLAGLTPNSVIFAAAPLCSLPCPQNFLQAAIMNHFCVTDYNCAVASMNLNPDAYLVQNNAEIINGTYDLHALTIPKYLQNAKMVRVDVTVLSQPFKIVYQEPELSFGIYRNIDQANLAKKFETQQFLHHYLMTKYQTTLKTTALQAPNGLQKLSGVIDLTKLKNPSEPLQVGVTYTEGGFKKGQKFKNPKTLVYAYIVQFSKV